MRHDDERKAAERVAYALDPGALDARSRADIEADPEDLERAADVRSFVERCRRMLASEAVDGELGLLERILARTTREDLSWRGDLRLLGRFVRARLAASRLLRVAAAVLAVHVAGLSVLAYQVLVRAHEPHLNVDFELPARPPFVEVEEEPQPDLSIPRTLEEPRVHGSESPGASPGER